MKREKSRECTFLLLFSNDFHAVNEVAKQLDMLIENQNDINENKEDPIIAKEADREYITAKMDEEVPQKVAIDQAINLDKKYGGEESSSFVNGILAKLY